nr:hypothetical protein [Lelliottia steviae]
MYAETGKDRIRLQEDTDILDIDYEGRFNSSQGNALFKIELMRSNGQNAISEVELPLNFTILSPSDDIDIKYNQLITVLFDGVDTDSKTEFVVDFICDNKLGGTFSGTSSHQLESTSNFSFSLSELQLIESANSENYKNCELDLTVNRYRVGNISDKFAVPSHIRAEQTRKIENITFTF